jgi:hypothetical protein
MEISRSPRRLGLFTEFLGRRVSLRMGQYHADADLLGRRRRRSSVARADSADICMGILRRYGFYTSFGMGSRQIRAKGMLSHRER